MFPDGTIATFAFDQVGRRTTMADWGGTSTYSFDALGRQSGQTDASGFVQAYQYDPNGNRTALQLATVGNVTYTYDELNRLATAMKPGNQLYTLVYDNDSRRTTMMLGLGTTRKYAFDNRGQLTTQIEANGATNLFTIVDGYDPVGNRITRDFNGNPITWIYDDLYRLTGQAKAGQVCTYTLDGVGNLKTMWEGGDFPKTFTFNAADRLVTMVEGANLTTYAYTGYGALESEITGVDTTAYTYSGQDQLIGVNPPNGRLSTYSFDGDGLRRTIQEGNVQATSVVWDGSDYLYLKRPGISPSQVVLTLDSEIVHAGGKDLLTDPLGSLVKEISAGASLGSLIEMYPYGSLVAGTGNPTTPYVYIAASGCFRDTGDRDYVMARELYKKLGRWMQVDPLWPEEYSYCYATASPITYEDRNGLGPERVPQLPPRPPLIMVEGGAGAAAAGSAAVGIGSGVLSWAGLAYAFLKCWEATNDHDGEPPDCWVRERNGFDILNVLLNEYNVRLYFERKCVPEDGTPVGRQKPGPAKCSGGRHLEQRVDIGKRKMFASVICCPCWQKARLGNGGFIKMACRCDLKPWRDKR